MRSTSSLHDRGFRGFTLLEVLAALVVLGTLMTGAMLAKSRYARQSTLADRKLDATREAEQLLQGWWGDPPRVPRDWRGTLAGGELTWRTSTKAIQAPGDAKLQVTRLAIFDATDRNQEPLVTVELLMTPPTPEHKSDRS
jgi:prepilin-type N-terminal cleavage/methylation domain-containing protein